MRFRFDQSRQGVVLEKKGGHIAAALVFLAGISSVTSAWAIDSFTATYKNGNTTENITGREPTAAGKYPVFIYTVGTTENFQHTSAIAAIEGMANRGYVSATVQYPNSNFGNCSTIGGRAKAIYDPNSSTSAVTALCARAKADCSKGIVVGGFSQGSVIATLAKNFEPRVQAAYAIGAHNSYSFFNLTSCMNNGNHAISNTRLRVVNGEVDTFGGGNQNAVRTKAQGVTGLNCGSTATSCLQSNGSGWILVLNNQVQDGSADHCYMRQGGCVNTNNLDPGWQNGADPWELNANLDWLTQFTAH
jgi:hypothetical protein